MARFGRAGTATLVTAIGIFGLGVINSTPASAVTPIHVMNDRNEVIGTAYHRENRRIVAACDKKTDNIGVYTEYFDSGGDLQAIADTNAWGCSEESPPGGRVVTSYRVCARYYRCSAWYPA